MAMNYRFGLNVPYYLPISQLNGQNVLLNDSWIIAIIVVVVVGALSAAIW
jgi:hypothetical protein